MKFVTAEEAVKIINSNDRVFIQSVAAPQTLIRAMTAPANELRGESLRENFAAKSKSFD